MQKIANKNKFLFIVTGCVARMTMYFNRPLFTHVTDKEEICFLFLNMNIRKTKRIFKKIGFTNIGCGYPHTRNQMWMNWRLCKKTNKPFQLHARFRLINDSTFVSVHLEWDWASLGRHPPDSYHPASYHYDWGEIMVSKIIIKKIKEGKLKCHIIT